MLVYVHDGNVIQFYIYSQTDEVILSMSMLSIYMPIEADEFLSMSMTAML